MLVYSILSKKDDQMVTEAPDGNSGIVERLGIPRVIRKLVVRLLLVMTSRNVLTKPIIVVVSVTGKVTL